MWQSLYKIGVSLGASDRRSDYGTSRPADTFDTNLVVSLFRIEVIDLTLALHHRQFVWWERLQGLLLLGKMMEMMALKPRLPRKPVSEIHTATPTVHPSVRKV